MLRRLIPNLVLGPLALALLIVSVVIAFLALLPAALVKLVIPVPAVRAWLTRNGMDPAGNRVWWFCNRCIYLLLHGTRPKLVLEGELDPNKTWLLVCNHQAWADIILLVDLLSFQVPFFRFFLKRQLIWVPVIGFACWAFDMPFMKRHSKAAIAANPALARQDLEATRAACLRYRRIPVTVVNYLEGTRFTEAKRASRNSPYRHLLRPKAAGLAFALEAMGDQFAGIIDVTLCYAPSHHNKLWSFLIGEQRHLRSYARVLPVPPELMGGNYATDAAYRERFQAWVNALWERKDAQLERVSREFLAGS
jgi:1-acyl-sn-glycerol-3-phosphate acyltransferase